MSAAAKTDSSTPSTYTSSSGTTVTTYETGAATVSTFDTQPIDEIHSQEEEIEEKHPDAWGQLNVLGEKFSYDLKEQECYVGRSKDNEIVLNAKIITSSLFCMCSKKQFKIYVETGKTGRFVFLQDMSTNGTFVNGELVGKNKFVVLKSGDVISLGKKEYRVFYFIDFKTQEEDEINIPNEVKDKYMILRVLGRGACGVVRLAVKRSDKSRHACKCIELKQFSSLEGRSPRDRTTEVEIMGKLNYPFIIRISEVVQTDEMLFIFMELTDGGDLYNLIKTQVRLDDEQEVKRIIYQISLAIKYLHDQNVVHRDLKPENILLTCLDKEYQMAKVTDFGVSTFVNSSSLLHTLCGTPYYLAPEILAGGGFDKKGYTKAVDCWALGVIIYVCVTGQPAFSEDRDDLPLKEQILTANVKLKDKYWEHLSLAKDIVQKLLKVKPEERLTIDEVVEHPWFQDDDLKSHVNKLMSQDKQYNLAKYKAQSCSNEGNTNDTPGAPPYKKHKLEHSKENESGDSSTSTTITNKSDTKTDSSRASS